MDAPSTAAAIAFVRAEEGRRPPGDRLFEDRYAALWAAEGAEARRLFLTVPFFVEHVRLRTRFLDDEIRSAVARGCEAIVLLGAGFDSRALRLPELAGGRVEVYEVDHEAQLAAKRVRLAANGTPLPAFVRTLAVDLAGPGLAATLSAAGLRPGAGTLFVAEGLIGYLAPAAVAGLFAECAAAAAAPAWLAASYSRFTFQPAQVEQLLGRAGFGRVSHPTYQELHRRYLGTDAPEGWESFVLTTAALGEPAARGSQAAG
ncbi:MAG: class I SAM-dependent methyltransferase [Polyangiaceae bacterium]|nr:class I SAM-dependent methyltransferase [Polyangiaceae bacterium]